MFWDLDTWIPIGIITISIHVLDVDFINSRSLSPFRLNIWKIENYFVGDAI